MLAHFSAPGPTWIFSRCEDNICYSPSLPASSTYRGTGIFLFSCTHKLHFLFFFPGEENNHLGGSLSFCEEILHYSLYQPIFNTQLPIQSILCCVSFKWALCARLTTVEKCISSHCSCPSPQGHPLFPGWFPKLPLFGQCLSAPWHQQILTSWAHC